MASGIQVASAGPVYVGSTYLGNFNGTALGNTIHVLAANLPFIVYFNGVVVYQRNPPTPSPVPPQPSFVEPPYQAVGFDSSIFNLGSYFYFLPDFLGESSLERRPLIFVKG